MKDQKEVVKKVIDYIEKNLEKEINLDKSPMQYRAFLNMLKK